MKKRVKVKQKYGRVPKQAALKKKRKQVADQKRAEQIFAIDHMSMNDD